MKYLTITCKFRGCTWDSPASMDITFPEYFGQSDDAVFAAAKNAAYFEAATRFFGERAEYFQLTGTACTEKELATRRRRRESEGAYWRHHVKASEKPSLPSSTNVLLSVGAVCNAVEWDPRTQPLYSVWSTKEDTHLDYMLRFGPNVAVDARHVTAISAIAHVKHLFEPGARTVKRCTSEEEFTIFVETTRSSYQTEHHTTVQGCPDKRVAELAEFVERAKKL